MLTLIIIVGLIGSVLDGSIIRMGGRGFRK